MTDMADYIAKKTAELGLHREDQLTTSQSLLNARYPGQTRVLSLNGGLLRIVTPNASVASELRLRQLELLQTMNRDTNGKDTITKLIIQVRSLD